MRGGKSGRACHGEHGGGGSERDGDPHVGECRRDKGEVDGSLKLQNGELVLEALVEVLVGVGTATRGKQGELESVESRTRERSSKY